MAAPTARDVAQRPRNQNNKPVTNVPAPAPTLAGLTSPIIASQLNMRSIFSGSASVGAGPDVTNLFPGLAVPAGSRLWSALHPTDGSGTTYLFGNCPTSVLFIRFTMLPSGLISVDLVNNHASPHTADWAVGYVVAAAATIPGATP